MNRMIQATALENQISLIGTDRRDPHVPGGVLRPPRLRSLKLAGAQHALILSLSILALVACGNTAGDRALSGAGIGAGVGAVGGLMVGAPLEGAAIGAAVGAGTGALTDKNRIDLGKPFWR